MAANANVLEEFLIGLGFKVDAGQYRDFQSKIKFTNEKFAEMAKVAAAATALISTAILKTASDLEQLYFMAQRAGSSTSGLMALRYGAEQIGVGLGTASAALQGMATALRSNPALAIFFNQLGIKQTSDNAQNLLNLVIKLRDLSAQGPYGHAIATQIAAQFGIDEQTLFMLERNLPELIRSQQEFRNLAAKSGVDLDKQSAAFHQFMVDVRRLLASVELLAIAFGGRLLPFAESLVHLMQQIVDFLLQANQATHGWSTALGGIVAAIASAWGGIKAIGGIMGMFGAGAGAAAAEGGAAAAGGGAAAAGGAPLLLIIVAAVAAIALAWLGWHYRDKIAATTGSLYERGKTAVGNFIAAFEGKSLSVYRDLAGKATIGYGHEVKPGEDFSGGISNAQALQLLAQDTRGAMEAVKTMVKSPLTENQLTALTDLVYNIGAARFARSTLLKDLNAGDYADAAAEFGKWNKVRVNGALVASEGLTKRRLGERDLFNKPDVTMNQETTIHVSGTADPRETGRAVVDEQRNVNGSLLRDLSGAVQ
jgi:lysozyme